MSTTRKVTGNILSYVDYQGSYRQYSELCRLPGKLPAIFWAISTISVVTGNILNNVGYQGSYQQYSELCRLPGKLPAIFWAISTIKEVNGNISNNVGYRRNVQQYSEPCLLLGQLLATSWATPTAREVMATFWAMLTQPGWPVGKLPAIFCAVWSVSWVAGNIVSNPTFWFIMEGCQ